MILVLSSSSWSPSPRRRSEAAAGSSRPKKTAATFVVAGRTYDISDDDLQKFQSRYYAAMRLLGRRARHAPRARRARRRRCAC